jgi:hypothetical protein
MAATVRVGASAEKGKSTANAQNGSAANATPEILTVEAAVNYLHSLGMTSASKWTLLNWIRGGLLPALRPGGSRRVYIRRESLDNFIGKSERRARP